MSVVRLDVLPRRIKRLIFFVADTTLIPISLYVGFALRYGTATPPIGEAWPLFGIMCVIGAALILFFRLPNIKLLSFESRGVMRIGLTAINLMGFAIISCYFLGLPGPRSVPAIFATVFFLGAVSMRVLGLQFLNWMNEREALHAPVAIYGAGAAAIQLASALKQSREVRPVLFVDDNPNLHGLMIAGLPVLPPAHLGGAIRKYRIQKILIAMPSIAKNRQKELIQSLAQHDVEVQVLPSFIDMMAGKGFADTLRPVSPDELLGRSKVELDTPEIAKSYAGRVVMVTGAGGSIGSELCRQMLNCNPARIVLFEQAEFQLYTIDRELRPLAQAAGIPLTARLGSVTDKARVHSVIQQEGVDIILHAAAYKHVPLVEDNELEGARNNVLGTQIVAEAAQENNLERFILISTDKAVRPTNIMGASKRLAELVIQDLHSRSGATKFAMVRFGNVLGSSGSVLPLFQKQIAAGGPVTVTHPEVTRFFMTIPEAARLVLLAGAYASGGDVFVLDMGAPQKIIDIARQMIKLSGHRVKDPDTGIGDIAIQVTGLRPGEKLYEELLIDDDSLRATPHPKILRAEEAVLSQIEIAAMLRELRACVATSDTERLRAMIIKWVDGYHLPESEQSQAG
ncbi:MAG: polysaccharide biosynthesis protein [Paracoccaceae bacterium]